MPHGTSRSSAMVSATRGRGAAVLVGLGVGLRVAVLGPGVGEAGRGVGLGVPLPLGAVDGDGAEASGHPESTAIAAPAELASSARRESMIRLFTEAGITPQVRPRPAAGISEILFPHTEQEQVESRPSASGLE